MAGLWVVDSSHPQDELRGTDQLVKVQVVNVHTTTSLIYWQERFDLPLDHPGVVAQYLTIQAQLIEGVMENPAVLTMQYEQDVNPAGQLVDVFEIYVQSTSGRSTGSFVQPYATLSLQIVDPLITAEVALLDGIEAA